MTQNPAQPSAANGLIVSSLSAQGSQPAQQFTTAFTVGRSQECDVHVVHPVVSRRHLEVVPEGRGWRVRAVGRNGMIVDGVLCRETLVTRPVRIQIGDTSGPGIALTPARLPSAASAVSATTTTTGIPPQTAPRPVPTVPPGSAPSAATVPPASAPSAATGPVGYPPRSGPGPAPASYSAHLPPAVYEASPQTSQIRPQTGSMPPVAQTGSMPPVTQTGSMPPVRHAQSAPTTVRSFRVTDTATIGRGRDNAIPLPDPLVSKHHARVDATAQGIVVTDLGSTNGIFFRGVRVPSLVVTEPVVLGMGSNFVAINPDGLIQVQAAAGSTGDLVAKDIVFTVDNGRMTLLDQISFSLSGHELLAVVGPSGAGKSTLLKALTGEQKAQHGEVLFDGLNVYEHYPIMRNKIGVVPQTDVIHSALTVRQTLNYAAELRFAKDVTKAERTARIDQVLEDLDLTPHVDKRVKKLSGGQKKRVSTAIELLTSPSLLFLDEPTSGLDPQLDRDVMQLLASLAHGTRPGDSGRTVVVVTHNETHIDRADKVLILAAGGKPVYYGPPSHVLPYFQERLAEIAARGELMPNPPRGTLADPTAINGYADVYALMRNHTPSLRAHLEATVPSTRRGQSSQPRPVGQQGPTEPPPRPLARQISTLVRRQLRIVLADPSYLGFMLILPVIMGLLTKVIEGKTGFALPDPPKPSGQARMLLVVMVISAIFAGMSATIRDLVKERDIFLREAAVGLRPGAYMGSKTVMLALVVTVQTSLMVGIALLLNDAPSEAAALGGASLELYVDCWLSGFVAGILGLAVSALVSTSEQVMPVLVVTIMTQLVFSGGFVTVTGRAVLDQISWLMPARWGYALVASTVHMNRMSASPDALWNHSAGQWWWDALVLLVLGAIAAAACLRVLVHQARR